jgi:CubicO group peptidase (beta-lactamase class C family)
MVRSAPPRSRWILPALASLLLAAGPARAPAPAVAAFDRSLDSLAAAFHIPGLSAAIVVDGRMVWSKGYGFADLERHVRATAKTPYRIASLTKPLAATVLMELVDEGRLDLDAPMKDFDIHAWFEPGGGSWAHYPSRYLEKPITVRHVLTHTSQSDPPGESYKYNGNIFADLGWVIEKVTGESYPVAMRDRLLRPAGMRNTVPGELAPWGQGIVKHLAKAYSVEGGAVKPGTYPGFGIEPGTDVSPWNLKPAYPLPATTDSARRVELGSRYTPLYSAQTAAGVVSTVEDLARFDIAYDAGRLVRPATRERMFTAFVNSKGDTLPYGLGWFVEHVAGTRVIWHFGWYPPTISALYVKVPERRLTLLLLANCDALSAHMTWTADGVRASPFARLFLADVAGIESP